MTKLGFQEIKDSEEQDDKKGVNNSSQKAIAQEI